VLPIGSGPDITPGQVDPPVPDPVVLDAAITAASIVGLFKVATFQLTFAGGAGATVSYTITDGIHTVGGQTTIGGDGHATVTVDLSSLNDGTLTVNATETDANLNTETYPTATLTKDTVAPTAPTVTLDTTTDSGTKGDWVTNSGMPIIDVAGETGAVQTIYVDGVVFTNGTNLSNGTHTVYATLTDAAGNVSAPSATQTLTISGANTFVTSIALNSGLSLTNHRVVTFGVAATSTAPVIVSISINGGAPVYTGAIAGAGASLTLPATEGVYTVSVTFTDTAGNTSTLTRTVTLDMTGPNVVVSLSPPTNGMYYDVGSSSRLTWTVTDANGVGASSGSVGSQTISASGGQIDLDQLTAGAHTVTVNAYDAAGNLRSVSLVFTIRVTAPGLLNALNDGIGRGWVMSAALQTTLRNDMNNVIAAVNKPGNGNTAAVRLRSFVSDVTAASGTQLTAAFKALLLNWAADLATRL
jgi:hypothetical protein